MIKVNYTKEDNLHQDWIKDVVKCLKEGGVIVAPTDTLYGLFCNALDEKALDRVIGIKGRSREKAMPVAVSGIEQARMLSEVNQQGEILIEKFWPGALTLVLPARDGLPSAIAPEGTIGVRAPDHPLILHLLQETHLPLLATSANLAGDIQPQKIELINDAVLTGVDYVIDQRSLPDAQPSTVVSLVGAPPRILREGVLKRDTIALALGCAIL